MKTPAAAGRTCGIRIERNLVTVMRDGAVLRSDLWRPDDDQPHPVLVQRTPYRKEVSGSDDFLRLELAVPHGYAVLVQDVRGRFESEGEWGGMTAAGWDQEANDTYDTVEWAAIQPWCDGSVALYGCSYLGAVAILGAALRPPHLKAIAPAFIGSEQLAHLDTGGAFLLKQWVTYQLRMAVDRLPVLLERGDVSAEEAERLQSLVRDPRAILEYLPLEECPFFDSPAIPVSLRDVLTSTGFGLPETLDFDAIEVPVLFIGGWYDLYPARTIANFGQLRTALDRSSDRLVMGPWAHSVPSSIQGDVDFTSTAAAIASVHPYQLQFFDKHLRGREVDLPAVRYFLMGENEWRDAGEWPPAGSSVEAWYLHEGSLSPQPPEIVEGVDRFRYDPLEPVPTIGGQVGWVGGPRDQSRLDKRSDVLRYLSEPLAVPVDIVGEVNVVLFASSSAVDTDFVAKFVDIRRDGAAMLIATGLVRARWRNGGEASSALRPGQPQRFEIALGPTAVRIPAGNRLGLYVCSSDFPWFDRNMNTGNDIGRDKTGVVAEQAVFRTHDMPSRLELSVVRDLGGLTCSR